MIWLLAKYILKAALRDRLPLIFLISVFVIFSLSAFIGGSAITEQDQFAIIFTANTLRFLSVSFIILYISFYFNRSFETRDAESLLTRPFSRLQYLLGHYCAFQLIVGFFIGVSFLMMVLIVKSPSFQNLIWVGGLWIELSLVATIAIFFGMLCKNNIAAILLSFAFYILGRLSGSLLHIVNDPSEQSVLIRGGEILVQVISVILPRFDLMVQSSWLLYETNFSMSFFYVLLAQLAVFTGLVISATYYDLIRKQF